MATVRESSIIAGVQVVRLEPHEDGRGRFVEVFRKEWFPEWEWEAVQWSRSESTAGVLRGLHYHHHQVDYWHCVTGEMRVGLVDLRLGSHTRGASEIITLRDIDFRTLFIPPGVAHGFYAERDVVLFYLVNEYYDGSDEWGVAWDDPALSLDWGKGVAPILSPRDQANPFVADIPENQLPR